MIRFFFLIFFLDSMQVSYKELLLLIIVGPLEQHLFCFVLFLVFLSTRPEFVG